MSIFKNIKTPLNSSMDDTVKDMWWFANPIPPYCLLMAFDYFVATPLDLNLGICMVFALIGTVIQGILFYNVIYWHTYTPFQLVGAKGKFMIEFIPALIASVWHQFLVFKHGGDLSLSHLVDYEYGPLFLLLACTAYFHLIAHFMHRAYDITAVDVFVGSAMQAFCYMVCGELFNRVAVLIFCFGLSIFRYMICVVPDVIPHPKRESEDLLEAEDMPV